MIRQLAYGSLVQQQRANRAHMDVYELFGCQTLQEYQWDLSREGPRILDRIRKKGDPK